MNDDNNDSSTEHLQLDIIKQKHIASDLMRAKLINAVGLNKSSNNASDAGGTHPKKSQCSNKPSEPSLKHYTTDSKVKNSDIPSSIEHATNRLLKMFSNTVCPLLKPREVHPAIVKTPHIIHQFAENQIDEPTFDVIVDNPLDSEDDEPSEDFSDVLEHNIHISADKNINHYSTEHLPNEKQKGDIANTLLASKMINHVDGIQLKKCASDSKLKITIISKEVGPSSYRKRKQARKETDRLVKMFAPLKLSKWKSGCLPSQKPTAPIHIPIDNLITDTQLYSDTIDEMTDTVLHKEKNETSDLLRANMMNAKGRTHPQSSNNLSEPSLKHCVSDSKFKISDSNEQTKLPLKHIHELSHKDPSNDSSTDPSFASDKTKM
jgi:hypothetical protein